MTALGAYIKLILNFAGLWPTGLVVRDVICLNYKQKRALLMPC